MTKKLAEHMITALKIVADEAPTVAALVDTEDDYKILWANEKLRQLLVPTGVSPEGMRWGGRCPFAFGIDALDVLDEVVATKKPVRAEERPFSARVSSRFGETTYWNWKCLPAMTEDCPGCVLVMAENVTDKVARRAVQRQPTALFTGVVLDLPVGVAVIEPDDFRVLDANDIWLSYMPPEHQTRESIGLPLQDFMPNFEVSGIADVLRRVRDTREVFSSYEFEVRDPARGPIWWSITVRMMDTAAGVEALLVTVWEVTEEVNARRRMENSRQRAEAMLQVQHAIGSSLALDKVLGMITSYARNLMNSPAASVFLLSEDRQSFIPRAATGIDLTETGAKALQTRGSLANTSLGEHRLITVVDPESTEAETLPPLASGKPIAAIAVAPIEAEGKPIGVIEVYNDQHRRFTNDEVETLRTLATNAATAIINARLYEDARRSQEELRKRNQSLDNERKLLYAILDSIPDSIVVADHDNRVVHSNEAARRLFQIKAGRLVPIHEILGEIHPKTPTGEEITEDRHPISRALAGEQLRNYELTMDDAKGNLHYRSVSSAPVLDEDGNIIYAVMVGRDITEQKMAQAKLEEAYERERKIAQTLQQALLSEIPHEMPGIETAAIYQAGLTEAEIGGDFYDRFSPEDGKLAIVIGDVAGKGLKAAIQIAAVKYGIRSQAYDNPSPSHVVSSVNEVIFREQGDGEFVTLFYGVLDVRTGEMVFTNAGHEPPLLRRSDGEVLSLFSGGQVIGIQPGVSYEESSATMMPGDSLLLYTDGITEARSREGEMLGDERLTALWKTVCEDCKSADEELKAVHGWVKEFASGRFRDDVAMLVVTWSGG